MIKLLKAIIFAGSAIVACVACTTNLPPLPEASPSAYLLGPGDEIRIKAFRLDEISGDYAVGDTGVISLPLLDPIDAAKRDVASLEREIETQISEKALLREPSVSVQIQEYRPFFIVGEVQRPGQYAYVPKMRVITAISIAGGNTFRANTDKVVITRTVNGETLTGTALPTSLVLPGDTIRIYEGWF